MKARINFLSITDEKITFIVEPVHSKIKTTAMTMEVLLEDAHINHDMTLNDIITKAQDFITGETGIMPIYLNF